ncbi:MAG: hypothetical protein IKS20_01610 [Victivallales bacterium]|nr:hypothetical protein [Victivallales bacterium]
MGYYCIPRTGKKVDFSELPFFPCRPLDKEPTEDDWKSIPSLTSFCSRGYRILASTSDISAQFAVAQARAYVRIECKTYCKKAIPMRKAFKGWCFDNSAEITFANKNGIYQFQVNPNGALSKFSEALEIQDVKVTGRNEPGGWVLYFSTPQDKIFLGEDAVAFQVTVYDMDTVQGAVYYDCCTKEGCSDLHAVMGCLKISASNDFSPEYRQENLMPPDMERLKLMTLSVIKNSGLGENPELNTPEQIRGAAHDTGMALKPRRCEMPEVDFAQRGGKVRPLYGVNLGPNISNQSNKDYNPYYKKLGASSMRPHDAALANPGCRIVDTIFLFPLEHLDPKVPENYYFDQTDYYLKNTMDQGSEIYYRLGVSIDHAKVKFTALAPKDFNHYAEVCAGIVRHYNHGWANGFHWNIKYWEFWNEPESHMMWSKSLDEFFDLFVLVGKRLKAEFPEIKFGGPGAMSLSLPLFLQMEKKCRENGFTPDFISWHQYSSNMEGLRFQPFTARAFMDSLGWTNAEVHLTEWHYITRGPGSDEGIAEMQGVDSAAFTAGVIAGWQDTPMDLSHFYTSGNSGYGCFSRFGKPMPLYYGMCAVGDLQCNYKTRIKCEQGPGESRLIAAEDGKGGCLLLYSVLKMQETTQRIKLNNLPSTAKIKSVEILDEEHPVPAEGKWQLEGNMLVIDKAPGSAVIAVRMEL